MHNWPNFFIVGAPRCGTTSLHEYLKDVPDIFMSPIKEPHFFSIYTVPSFWKNIIRDPNEYFKLFEKVKNEKIIGESSTSYLSDTGAANLIHQTNPQSKILISLRDPIDRSISMRALISYEEKKNAGKFKNALKSARENKHYKMLNVFLKRSLYYEDVKRYLDIFGKDSVKIIIFEDFIQNRKETLLEILNFLNIKSPYFEFKEEIHNPNPTSKIILKTTDKQILHDFFFDDVKKLERLLNKKLPWLNFII